MSSDTQTLVFADKDQLRKELALADPATIHADPAADGDLHAQAPGLLARAALAQSGTLILSDAVANALGLLMVVALVLNPA